MSETGIREDTFRDALLSGVMDLEGMDALLELYRELYPLRRSDLKPEKQLRVPTEDELSMRLDEGFTLLEIPDLLPNAEVLAGQAGDVTRILSRHSEDPETVRATMGPFLENPDSFLGFAEAYMQNGEAGLRERALTMDKANPEVIMFVVFNALKGLFLETALGFAGIQWEQWNHGRCPVCGGEPAVAFLTGEGGKRSLVCHRCETHWRFRRLICPFCDHESPGESSYLFVEEPGYETITGHVCDQCRCYIKTWRVEDDDLGALHPEVEDLKTPAFDAALEAEDYRRGSPNIFGILIGTVRGGKEAEK